MFASDLLIHAKRNGLQCKIGFLVTPQSNDFVDLGLLSNDKASSGTGI
jgi:hypothetical protein